MDRVLPELLALCVFMTPGYINKPPSQLHVLAPSIAACYMEGNRRRLHVISARSFSTKLPNDREQLVAYCGKDLTDCQRVGL